jgi:signal transduction histidine kinase
MSAHRYRQLFLFLLVLTLPSIAIIVAGFRIAAQDEKAARQEAEQRAMAERKRTAEDIGKDLLARLERIKLQAIANATAAALPELDTSSGAVAAIGWLEGNHPVWTWDLRAESEPAAPPAAEFARAMDDAARTEFAERQYGNAAALYRQAIAATSDEKQRASAQLGLARALWRSGSKADAAAAYRNLLKLPATIADEYGLPFASYALAPLLELGAAGTETLDRILQDLGTPAMLTQIQTYRWKSALDRLAGSNDPRVRAGAAQAIERLSASIRDLDQAAALQKDFAQLRLTPEDWQPFRPRPDSPLWLVGRTPAGSAARPLVLAVRGERIFEGLGSPNSPIEITVNAESGESLSPRLAGLRANFARVPLITTSGNPRNRRSIWELSLLLIVTLTFILGFVLWRDNRREIHIAELRTQFVSSVSHELKTPLTSIRMFAEILQMRGYVDPKLHDEYLETIVNESERLTRLLNNVLDFSRIERGQKNYRLEPASLAEVIQSAVRTIQYPLTEQGFKLDLNIGDVPPVAVDRDAIQQAVLNLLTNAMKYSGKRRDIELRLTSENDTALIQVTDHGIGIPEKEQQRIFEKFYRAQVKENRAISGTGLGLALVTHIAEAHGGEVTVNSKLGEGSTFTLRLPLAHVQAGRMTVSAEAHS